MSWTLENYDVLAVALGEHVLMVGTALALSLLIALPLGILTARRPAFYIATMSVTGILYTIPALALFALLIPTMGLGLAPAITALVLYSLLILVRNVDAVDHNIRQARHHKFACSLFPAGAAETWQRAQQPHRFDDAQTDPLCGIDVVLSDVVANGNQLLPASTRPTYLHAQER